MRSDAATASDEVRRARADWLRALERTAPVRRNAAPILPLAVDGLAERFGERTALVAEDRSWSFADLARGMNRRARWALGAGVARGDVVCLVMESDPEYLATWLGLTRIGAVVALVNPALAGDSLARALGLVGPRHVIAGPECAAALPPLAPDIQVWPQAADQAAADAAPLGETECAAPALADAALFLYTSGTSGFPKAARVSHRRLVEWSQWFAGMLDTGPDDRIYNCLPMYHGVGGIAAIGAALVAGGSVALRPRFSARRFWADVVRWDCTLFQYIGELCRYLLKSPPDPFETRHRIRLACGNGLGPDIWQPFLDRFRIPRVLEFYAATEGALSLYNCEGRAGALGRIPGFLAHRAPATLIRVELDSGEPIRGADGFCQRCADNEPGEAIARVTDAGSGGAGRFEGYTDAAASRAKLLNDVFAAGDAWYRTGDLMRRDRDGFFYFVDRIGDSFRWKGETVSASEVAAVVAALPGVVDATAYGVRVPGADGRAGMAALVAGPGFELPALSRDLAARLPPQARPLFLRLCPALETTATLRPRNRDLARQGFDPAAISDPLYFNDRETGGFVPLDGALYRRILAGNVRF